MKIRSIIDKLLTIICLFIPFYLICHFFTENITIKIILASLFALLGLLVISAIQKITRSKVNYKNFELYVSVQGANYIYDKLIKIFDGMNFKKRENFLISPQNIMIMASIKFGNISPDEILKCSKTAHDNNAEKCYLIVRRNRNMPKYKKGMRYIDSPDTGQDEQKLAREISIDMPCLILLHQNGVAEGWKGREFWWPILTLPKNTPKTIYALPNVDGRIRKR